MAATYRASSATQAFGTASSASITIPSAVQVGDRMYLVATYKLLTGTGTVNTPSGWSVLFAPVNGPSGNSMQGAVFYKDAVSGDPGSSLTVNCSSGSQQLAVAFSAYSGVTGVRSSSFTVGSTTSSTSITCAAPGTAPQSGDLVVLIGSVRETTNGPAGEPTFTAPSGATIRAQQAGSSGSAQNIAAFIGDHDSSSGDRTVTASQTSVAIAGQIVLQGASALSRGTSESLTQSDAAARAAALPRGMSGSLTQADAAARSVALPRGPAESMSLGNAAAAAVVLSRGAAQSLTAADASARNVARLLAIAESLGVVDAAARTTSRPRPVAEPLSVADTFTRAGGGVTVPVDEALTVGDAAARAVARPRTTSGGAVSFDDVQAGTVAAARAAAETMAAGDAEAIARVVLADVAEPLTVADTTVRGVLGVADVAETVPLTHTVGRLVTRSRAVAQGLTVGDSWKAGRFLLVAVAEPLTVADTMARAAQTFGRPAAEALQLAHTVTRAAQTFGRDVAEALTTADDWLASRRIIPTAATAELVFSNSATRTVARQRGIAQPVTAADAAARSMGRARPVAQPVSVADLFSGARGRAVAAGNTVTIAAVLVQGSATSVDVAQLVLLIDHSGAGGAGVPLVIAHDTTVRMTSEPAGRVRMTSKPHGRVSMTRPAGTVRRTT